VATADSDAAATGFSVVVVFGGGAVFLFFFAFGYAGPFRFLVGVMLAFVYTIDCVTVLLDASL
jgi:hypothetical protein